MRGLENFREERMYKPLYVNSVQLTGRLVSDPEMLNLENNKVLKFTIAVSKKYKSKTGEWKEDTIFIQCEVWGNYGEKIHTRLSKGIMIYVMGSLKQDRWKKGNTGHSRVKVLINHIQVLQVKDETEEDVKKDDDDLPF